VVTEKKSIEFLANALEASGVPEERPALELGPLLSLVFLNATWSLVLRFSAIEPR
jgi:hypothetical protein